MIDIPSYSLVPHLLQPTRNGLDRDVADNQNHQQQGVELHPILIVLTIRSKLVPLLPLTGHMLGWTCLSLLLDSLDVLVRRGQLLSHLVSFDLMLYHQIIQSKMRHWSSNILLRSLLLASSPSTYLTWQSNWPLSHYPSPEGSTQWACRLICCAISSSPALPSWSCPSCPWKWAHLLSPQFSIESASSLGSCCQHAEEDGNISEGRNLSHCGWVSSAWPWASSPR